MTVSERDQILAHRIGQLRLNPTYELHPVPAWEPRHNELVHAIHEIADILDELQDRIIDMEEKDD